MLTVTVRNVVLNTLDAITWLSLHSEYSNTGEFELTGGSPAYARMATSFTAATSGVKTTVETVTFDVPAGATVAWIGLWNADVGGTFWGMIPNGGISASRAKMFVVDDPASNIFVAGSQVFWSGMPVVFWEAGEVLPTTDTDQINEGEIYYVEPVTTETFTVSAIQGGVPVDLTSTGSGYFQIISPQFFETQGTFRLNGLTFVMPGAY